MLTQLKRLTKRKGEKKREKEKRKGREKKKEKEKERRLIREYNPIIYNTPLNLLVSLVVVSLVVVYNFICAL